MCSEFWMMLTDITVPVEKWTADYYRNRMEHAYAVMRGLNSKGETLNSRKPLTVEQADAVICLFSQWLDDEDIRLAVPEGRDWLASSADGEYDWCGTCGKAIDADDVPKKERNCRKKGCAIRANRVND